MYDCISWIESNYKKSEFQPTGDQPQAIEELVEGFREENQFKTLLGVTGSGKTLTMANMIEETHSIISRK